MEEQKFVITADQENQRLDVFLTEQLEGSRSYIQQLIKDGHVKVHPKKAKPNLRLTEGMEITLTIPEPESTEVLPEAIPLDILYEDHDIIIVNKTRGMVVHPAVGNYSGTLVNALLYHCDDLSGINGEIRPGIVHRLDKETSGVMMAAKTNQAHLGLAEQVKAHSAKRTYYALVQGNIVEEKGVIKAPIGRHPKDRMKMAVVFENSKEAVTHFTVLERYGKHTLVECVLETGRTHQIRVHFAHIGHPVVNDPFYGYRKMDFPIEGQALHSRTLDIIHPISGEPMHFEAPLPKDFLDCIAYAKEHNH
ncbi:RluA family pseudouridine synthase [Veillonella magna]|uniref:Pseudouridine synthase n=1 Tax=Veillonella magna TaxID=464322 RepID=A0ABS2GDF9_9FIRM|nr:RluA family pseudouridine synthase [Veillonella magna]MBM6823659.1 RluA family pseudouridine synthase [Veillonella magna]MBM6912189.1 RluA family pseudouridine synthase [Veillonella magna]